MSTPSAPVGRCCGSGALEQALRELVRARRVPPHRASRLLRDRAARGQPPYRPCRVGHGGARWPSSATASTGTAPTSTRRNVARQSDLERCGWTFSRVREGAFRLEPGAALEDLWQTLERLGIFPAAGDASPDAADPTASPDSDQEFPDMLIDPETGQLRVEDRGPRPAGTLDRGRALSEDGVNPERWPARAGQRGDQTISSGEERDGSLAPAVTWQRPERRVPSGSRCQRCRGAAGGTGDEEVLYGEPGPSPYGSDSIVKSSPPGSSGDDATSVRRPGVSCRRSSPSRTLATTAPFGAAARRFSICPVWWAVLDEIKNLRPEVPAGRVGYESVARRPLTSRARTVLVTESPCRSRR